MLNISSDYNAFGFTDQAWHLIVSISDLCLLHYFQKVSKNLFSILFWMGKLLPLLKFFHDTDYAYNKYSKGTRVMTIRRLYSLNNRHIINEEIKDTNN